MQDSNLTEKICGICNRPLSLLGFEGKIIRNHEDKMEDGYQDMGAELKIDEFRVDIHLACRIKLARYYLVGLPTKWLYSNEFNITENNRSAFEELENIKIMNKQRFGLSGIYIYGTPGLGKTHLLTDLCKHFTDVSKNLNNISWSNTSSLLTKIRSSFGRKYDQGEKTISEKVLNKLKVRHLFLDDLGTEAPTEWAKEILYEAINHRYEEQLPLFVSSNLHPQKLSARMGDKLASRIIEMCKPVGVQGEDMRIEKALTRKEVTEKFLPVFSYKMAYWKIDG